MKLFNKEDITVYLSPSVQEKNIGYGNYGTEEKRCNQIADVIERILKRHGIKIYRNKPSWGLKEIKNDSNKKNPHIHFAIHTNAYNKKTRGCEVFCHKYGGEGHKLAKAVYKRVAKITPTGDRGIKQGYNFYRKGVHMYELARTYAPANLIEIAFHDNKQDAAWIINNIELIGSEIAKGILDYFGIDFRVLYSEKEKIMKRGKCDRYMLEKYFKKHNAKGLDNFKDIAKIYAEEGDMEGVDSDIAWVQMCHETNYLKFTGDVEPGQNNFCGLGAVGGGAKGNSFKTIREGVRAHIQHLKAYASKDNLRNPVVDPRFKYVKRGSAPYVSSLTGKWAMDPNYGKALNLKYDELIKLFENADWRDPYFNFLIEKGFIIQEKTYDKALTRGEFYVIMAKYLGIETE